MFTLPLLLLLLADIGPPPPECTRDRECELTTFVGCCGACCPGVRAAPKGKNERAACATMRCAPDECAEVKCAQPAPDLSLYGAACVERRCEAILKTAECRVAADCRLVEVAPVERSCTPDTCCCPVKHAQPRDAGVPIPVSPKCAQCPPETPSRAACDRGRCAVVRPPAPGSKKR